MTEGEIKRQICDYLELRRAQTGGKISFWMNETIAVRGRKRSGKYQKNGTSDLFLVMWGHFRVIEVKKPGGKPSDEQEEFIEEMERAEAAGVFVYTLEEAVFQIEKWIKQIGRAPAYAQNLGPSPVLW